MFIPSVFKSVQDSAITLTGGNTAILGTTVNLNYSYIEIYSFYSGVASHPANTDPYNWIAALELTSGTTVTAIGALSAFMAARFRVFEFYPGFLRQPVQRGTMSIGFGAAAATAVLTAVGSKAFIPWQGFYSEAGGAYNMNNVIPQTYINTTTQITTQVVGGTVANTITVPWQVIDPR